MRNLSLKILAGGLMILIAIHSIDAQTLVNDDISRKVNIESLKLIDQYQNAYYLKRGRDYDDFINLFTSNSSEVFNSIMPDNKLDTKVPVNEFLDILNEHYSKPMNVEILPYEVSPIDEFNGETGLVSIFCKIFFSGYTDKKIDYKDSFNIKIVIAFNYATDEYKIQEINAIENYGKFIVITAYVKSIFGGEKLLDSDSILINNNAVPLDQNSRCILKRVYDSSKIRVQTYDEDIIGTYFINSKSLKNLPVSKDGDKNTRKLYFKKPFFTLNLDFAYNPFELSPMSYQGDINGIKLSNDKSLEIGVKLGVLAILKKNVYFTTGIQYKKIRYSGFLENYKFSFMAYDPANQLYLRTCNINDIHEVVSLEIISIPLGIQKQFKLGQKKKFFYTLELGVEWNKSLSASYYSNATGLFSGYYKDLYHISIAENGVYDFGSFTLEGSENLFMKDYFCSPYIQSTIGYNINRAISTYFLILYNKGFTKIYHEDIERLSINEHDLKSLANIDNSFYQDELFLGAGIKYKF